MEFHLLVPFVLMDVWRGWVSFLGPPITGDRGTRRVLQGLSHFFAIVFLHERFSKGRIP